MFQLSQVLLRDQPPRVVVLVLMETAMYSLAALTLAYGGLVGAYPRNAFLAALFGSLGLAVLAMALRLQLTQQQHPSPSWSELSDVRKQKPMSETRAFVEYSLASTLILLSAYTFLG
eukprot:Protomagalhaensia_wolfi_Nauph_80__5806@NODE_723_length_2067_cov_167_421105_g539_i0_p3_GENE_NODE_723_length_2067_cov_167_421105_g539_i0NODE_723_length_2067_cov_167_421105_g539_i0_p3_ORF_typecomplete_len117_score20_96DAD/PF02109_16/1_9e13DUF4131/PF13567_6/0_057_NODE_723_length_2067_cov_167_421105_g539_i015451895